jgi:hypothetical protein
MHYNQSWLIRQPSSQKDYPSRNPDMIDLHSIKIKSNPNSIPADQLSPYFKQLQIPSSSIAENSMIPLFSAEWNNLKEFLVKRLTVEELQHEPLGRLLPFLNGAPHAFDLINNSIPHRCSVRLSNVLHLSTNRQLSSAITNSAYDFLKIKNCGVTTVAELIGLLLEISAFYAGNQKNDESLDSSEAVTAVNAQSVNLKSIFPFASQDLEIYLQNDDNEEWKTTKQQLISEVPCHKPISVLFPCLSLIKERSVLNGKFNYSTLSPFKFRTASVLGHPHYRIYTWGDLGEVTIDIIRTWKNVGKTTIEDLIDKLIDVSLIVTMESSSPSATSVDDQHGIGTFDPEHIPVTSPSHLFSSSLTEISLLADWLTFNQSELNFESIFEIAHSSDLPEDVRKSINELSKESISDFSADFIPLETLLTKLLNSLDDRTKEILESRHFLQNPPTLEELGAKLGVTRERIRQIESKGLIQLRWLLKSIPYRSLNWAGWLIHHTVGSIAPASHPILSRLHTKLGLENQGSLLWNFLLWAAGDYRISEDWICRKKNYPDWYYQIRTLAKQLSDKHGLVDLEKLLTEMRTLGIRECFIDELLDVQDRGLKRFADQLVVWPNNILERAITTLAMHKKPMSSSGLIRDIGGDHSPTGLRERLHQDNRVIKVTKTDFALAEWGEIEYSGIVEEIKTLIIQAGGQKSAQSILDFIPNQFEVAESSVRIYLESPMFIIEDNMVRLRSTEEEFQTDSNISSLSSVYLLSNHLVCLRLKIDHEALRGSGIPLHVNIATLLGVNPGVKINYQVEICDINVPISWPSSQPHQANVGSIRQILKANEVNAGDRIRLIFDTNDHSIQCHMIDESIVSNGSPNEALYELTGLKLEATQYFFKMLATAMQTTPGALRKTLLRRKEDELLRILPRGEISKDLEDSIESLADLL